MSKTIRIATVKATGERFLVQQLTIASAKTPGRVHCWGQVTRAKGLTTTHGESKTFTSEAVEVTEVVKTAKLVEELFHQNVRALQAKGNVITASRSGRTYTNHGTEAQIKARAEYNARIRADLSSSLGDIFMTVGSAATAGPRYRGEPAITRGPDKAIPETRENILTSIVERLTATGAPAAIRQDYSNGEFTSSSLIVGLTFEAVAARELELEVAGYTVHFDSALGIFWRKGGSWD